MYCADTVWILSVSEKRHPFKRINGVCDHQEITQNNDFWLRDPTRSTYQPSFSTVLWVGCPLQIVHVEPDVCWIRLSRAICWWSPEFPSLKNPVFRRHFCRFSEDPSGQSRASSGWVGVTGRKQQKQRLHSNDRDRSFWDFDLLCLLCQFMWIIARSHSRSVLKRCDKYLGNHVTLATVVCNAWGQSIGECAASRHTLKHSARYLSGEPGSWCGCT